MDEASLIGSLDRIEAALGRIEAAALAAASREPEPHEIAPDTAADHDLARRHEQLRQSVTTALSRLDAMIGEQAE